MAEILATYSYTLQSDNTYSIICNNKNVCTKAIIPNEYEGLPVTLIGQRAFQDCSSLTSVVIGDSIKTIGYMAFDHCDSLTSVKIPNSVTIIGDYAFRYCEKLTNIIIPNSVTIIGDYSILFCSSLTSVVIPESVTKIGHHVFNDCKSLTSITVDENNSNYKSIDGNLYSKDGKNLLKYAVGKIDANFTIPDSVTSIYEWAFAYCSSLTSVKIGNNVTSINSYAFYDCDSLTSIVLLGNTPPTITSSSFSGIFVDAKFYCYKSLLDTYKTATNWNKYADKFIGDDLRIYFTLNAEAQKKYFATKEDVENARSNFNLENGGGEGSLQQVMFEDDTYNAKATGKGAVALGGKRTDKLSDSNRTATSAEGDQSFAAGGSSHAYGAQSIAMGKDAKAYQSASFAFGGSCQAGMTEDEFIERYQPYSFERDVPYFRAEELGDYHGKTKKFLIPGNLVGKNGKAYIYSFVSGLDLSGLYVYYSCGNEDIKLKLQYKDPDIIFNTDPTTSSIIDELYFTDESGKIYSESTSAAIAGGSSNKSLGRYSVSFGDANINKGHAATALGASNKIEASGRTSFTTGYSNYISGESSSTFGNNNHNHASRGSILGSDNVLLQNSKDSILAGKGLTSRVSSDDQYGESKPIAIFGQYNDYLRPRIIDPPQILVVGNGQSSSARSTAFAVYEDGRAMVQTAPASDSDLVRLKELREHTHEQITAEQEDIIALFDGDILAGEQFPSGSSRI